LALAWVCLLGCRLLVLGETTGVSATEEVTEDRVGPIKLDAVPLESVLELLEQWTGKTLLKPQTLPNTPVSLNLKEEVTKAEALQAIETLLTLNGVAVTPLGDRFLKVIPLNGAKGDAPVLIEGSTLSLIPSGRIAVKLFHLNFLRAAEFTPQISGLLSPGAGSQPVVFEKANAILVTDAVTNLQRIETLLVQLDQPSRDMVRPRFYTIQHAKASEVVTKIKAMLTGPQQAQLGASTNYSADDRTNQVVLFADPRHHALFDELIVKLDANSGQDTRNEIIPLNHAAAKDVAALLTQIVTSQATSAKNAGQEFNRSGTAKSTVAGASPAEETSGLPRPLSAEPFQQFSPLLAIMADERSNALVISGTVDDLRLIKEMVARLDVLLAQVRIEVVIAEVTLSNNSTTGISELGLQVDGDKLIGFSGSFPGVSISEGTVTRGTQDLPVTGPWDLAAQIKIATTPRKSNANILSVPNIVTTHNREGKIFVGEERPVISSYLNDGISGTGGGSGVSGGYRTTVNSKDIGIQLSVKPLIGPDGSVQLEIKQEVNDILGEITIDGNPQPRIGRRSTESFISVHSGEIIVLGGLQRRTDSVSTSRLGPIPIIGDLLGARNREKTRTDLLFFLRPTILTGTPKDHEPALAQLQNLPKRPRKEILEIIGSQTPP
jgi:general secretion pathway protein D